MGVAGSADQLARVYTLIYGKAAGFGLYGPKPCGASLTAGLFDCLALAIGPRRGDVMPFVEFWRLAS